MSLLLAFHIFRILILSGSLILLLGISVHDIRSHMIPNRYILCLFLWVSLGHITSLTGSAISSGLHVTYGRDAIWPVGLTGGLISALVTLLCLAAVNFACMTVLHATVIGGGDLKLLGVGALALGSGRLLVAMALAVLLCFASVIIKCARTRCVQPRKAMIAFGPFISTGLCLSYLCGGRIIQWYIT